jgi:hypothetical protein
LHGSGCQTEPATIAKLNGLVTFNEDQAYEK